MRRAPAATRPVAPRSSRHRAREAEPPGKSSRDSWPGSRRAPATALSRSPPFIVVAPAEPTDVAHTPGTVVVAYVRRRDPPCWATSPPRVSGDLAGLTLDPGQPRGRHLGQ